MTRALLPFQGFPSALVSGLLDLGCGRGVQSTIDGAHTWVSMRVLRNKMRRPNAQTRCADQMRYHQGASRPDIAILEGRFGFR
jgi:hypothetical protein